MKAISPNVSRSFPQARAATSCPKQRDPFASPVRFARPERSKILMTRHFLDLADAGPDALRAMLDDARNRKLTRAGWPKGKADVDKPLDGHVLAMIFEKN